MYDHIGIGFGPANLALCISLHESEEARAAQFSMCFLEKQPQFAWHPSLLLPGAQLQVSPLKDLATMRDPTSSYTFLNFLHCEGRLMQYINREEKVPSRREWSAYLAWAAQRMDAYVRYGCDVQDIVPETQKNGCVAYRVVYRRGGKHVESLLAQNVSLAVGGAAHVPRVFGAMYDPNADSMLPVVHASTFLPQMARLGAMLHAKAASQPLRFAIVGGGQSSAEILRYLRGRYPEAALDMMFRAAALVPSDDSPFVNSAAFDPSSVSTFWESSARQRRAQLAEFKRTNYSVVRNDLLCEVYEMVYDQEIEYREPDEEAKGLVRILASTELVHAECLQDGRIRIDTCTNAGDTLERSDIYDAVFLGTGFQRDPSLLPFVRTLATRFPLLARDGKQELEAQELALDEQVAQVHDPEALRAQLRGITRDYRLVPSTGTPSPAALPDTVAKRIPHSRLGREGSRESSVARGAPDARDPEPAPPTEAPRDGAVFVFGSNESTHGLSDSLMSMVAHRAGIVTASLLAAKHD
ncbi:taxifolin 8-monooxygenase [Malassezia equina]|uniref:L-ornithine N(5)-monooxygenase [NAD(P)H] n=1 Tax=Malassezia equina TaxID=1381935 RepID=A0AAF0IY44_9BASI|nr:taxifolin 8-monooxygenase [Malassezia equina]